MKCDIVQDLLPLYADGIVREGSREEIEAHLRDCPDCRTQWEQMTAVLPEQPVQASKEINFLKKIRRRHVRNILLCAGALVIVFGILSMLFAVGFPVKEEDMDYSYELLEPTTAASGGEALLGSIAVTSDGELRTTLAEKTFLLRFRMKDGRRLQMKTEYVSEKDEEGNIKKVICTAVPKAVLNNPFGDAGDSFEWGINFSQEISYEVVVKFADQEVVLNPQELLANVQK